MNDIIYGHVGEFCDAFHYLLDNILIRFGSLLYRQIAGIPMGTTFAPIFADLCMFCYERDFMLSLQNNKNITTFFSLILVFISHENILYAYFERLSKQPYLKSMIPKIKQSISFF